MRITDKQLRPIADRIAQTPTQRVDDRIVLEILAAVADKSGRTASQAGAEISAPGKSRADQLAIAQAGLSKRERTDIETLLDRSGFTFDAGAKNFLEALVGRAALTGGAPLPPPTTTTVTADERGIRGTLEAGMVIEAINLRDRELILANTFMISSVSLLALLLADILYALCDPRVAYD